MKLDYKKTFLLGLGFLTVSIVWAIYNVNVPIYLREFGLAGSLIGGIMAIDNIFAVIFQPIFGALSDRTNTRYGRRMPYLLIGIPLSALFFVLIPFASGSLIFLMVTVILLNFFMSIYRAPTVALMPDMTPAPLRSKANGVINFLGGLGTAGALLLNGSLFKLKEAYPFVAGSIIMMVIIIVMYAFVQEPKEPGIRNEKEASEEAASKPGTSKGKTLSLIFLLLAIFFWFTGYNAVETFFSTYGQVVLGVDQSTSSYLLFTVSAFFLLAALPAGILSGKIGRKKVIITGLLIFLACFVSMIFIRNITVMFVILGIAGISWALININSYPMVVEMTSSQGIGRYTGYYYFFSMLASIISPILFGSLKDLLGDGFLFIYSSIGILIALFFMMLVKHGEAKTESKSAFENLEHME